MKIHFHLIITFIGTLLIYDRVNDRIEKRISQPQNDVYNKKEPWCDINKRIQIIVITH